MKKPGEESFSKKYDRVSPQGTGYIVASNTGIQIVLKNGNKILVTTQKPHEVNAILQKMGML